MDLGEELAPATGDRRHCKVILSLSCTQLRMTAVFQVHTALPQRRVRGDCGLAARERQQVVGA